jgi:hypothetical protein
MFSQTTFPFVENRQGFMVLDLGFRIGNQYLLDAACTIIWPPYVSLISVYVYRLS